MFVNEVFSDLDTYVDLPRVEGLWLAPDGRRLVVSVATADRGRNRYTTALWEVDPSGMRPARRLTRGVRGESFAGFTPAGDLLFISARPEPGDAEERAASLWLQPARGGDARLIASPPGGVHGVVVSETGTVVMGSPLLPSSTDMACEAEKRQDGAKAGVSAILHEEFPIRFWDHDLGPGRTRLLAAEIEAGSGDAPPDLADVTGHVGRALDDECTWDITPDGRTVVAMWAVAEPGGSQRHTLVAIDVATGKRRVLADNPDHEYDSPQVSPDGTRVAAGVQIRVTPQDAGGRFLGIVGITGGELQLLTAHWDRWPYFARWTPDGGALVVAADDHGRSPLWRVDVATGEVTRLTQDHGAYTDLQISPDGRWVYARRSAIDSPPAPIRIALDGSSAAEPLRGPAETLGVEARIPGRLEEVVTTAEDGTPLRAWLAVPHEAGAASPAPLLLQIHGGPLMSSKAWHWRWNPWLAVARGYAVLLPDYALSTGYGTEFIRRGWGRYGGPPYLDLLALTDAAQRRADIADRAAAMGASFGGYLTNWIAGHTDRFAAIVSHASIWDLDESARTADLPYVLCRQMAPEEAERNSPHHFADAIGTPMLVIHGDKDYRVPVGQALRLWWDLSSRAKTENGSSPHKFLYFPDEGHFVLKPNNFKVCYQTFLAFLDHHVRDKDWQRPDLLG